jgi:nucleoside-diphosphate-sugar epimerase
LLGTRITADLARDHRVIGLDVKDPPKEWKGAAFVTCDLTDDAKAARALERVRRDHGERVASVLHLAAYYDFSGEPSPLYEELTVEGTRRLLRALKEFAGVEQFVFSSSLLVMKPVEEGEIITERSPVRGEWDYPRSKIRAEEVILAEHGAIPVVILRIAGVYDERGNSIPIAQHMARIHEKQLESYLFPGNPEHGQPFVHIDDVVACMRAVIGRRASLGKEEVFLVAEPDVVSYSEMQDALGQALHGKEWPTIRIPVPVAKAGAWVKEKLAPEGKEPFIRPWMVDMADDHYPTSIRRIQERVGWSPRRRLRDTLPAMAADLRRDPVAFYERHDLPKPDDLGEEER